MVQNQNTNICKLFPSLLKLMNFGVIVQKDELHKIFDYFSRAVIPFYTPAPSSLIRMNPSLDPKKETSSSHIRTRYVQEAQRTTRLDE